MTDPHPAELSATHATQDPSDSERKQASPPADDPALRNAELLRASLHKLQALLPTEPQLRAALPTDIVEREWTTQQAHDSAAVTRMAFDKYAQRPFLATRAAGAEAQWDYLTFGEVWTHVQSIGVALIDERSGPPLLSLGGSSMVGLLAASSPAWVAFHLAVAQLGGVTVPMPTQALDDEITYMLQHADVTVVAIAEAQRQQVIRLLPQCPLIKHVIVLDGANDADEEVLTFGERPVRVMSLSLLQSRGTSLVSGGWHFPSLSVSSDALMALIFTSGSTGRPKAAMYLERMWLHLLMHQGPLVPELPYLSLQYLPMHHLAGLMNLLAAIARGGILFFGRPGDMSTLLTDARLARPTFVMCVPRLATLLQEEYEAACTRAGAKSPEQRARVMDEQRTVLLGDRLLWLTVSTAPVSASTKQFLWDCFRVPVYDGYGQTESGGHISLDGHINRASIRAYKLLSQPALGYTVHDRPYPRGMLAIQSPMVIPGYYKNAAASERLCDAEGFMLTGDIVAELGPDRIAYVDRMGNVVKLAQGEFVQLAALEATFAAATNLIQRIFLYADSTQPFLVAVVDPNYDAVRAHLQLPPDALLPNAKSLKQALLSELSRVGAQAGLRSYEIPRDLLIAPEPFTEQNGLLTESNKLARAKIKARFQAELDALYAEADKRRAVEMDKCADADVPAHERALRCVAATLGIPAGELAARSEQSSFRALGGDSISAVRLHNLLRDTFGVAPSVAAVLNASTPLARVLASVKAMQEAASASAGASDKGGAPAAPARPTFAAIHGSDDADSARVEDLDLARFGLLPPGSLLPPTSHAQHVLLTGANGFFGRFLLLELLRALQEVDGTMRDKHVTVLVRAASDEAARQRLRQSFGSLAPQLAAYEKHVTVLAGELMQPQFGLPSDVYARLSRSVDSVLHNGALVNHSFRYAHLFEPNVLGTVEVIRFCLTDRAKTLTFTSSVAVLEGIGRATDESDAASKLWPVRPLTDEYAAGYASSKWASEVQLEQLARAPYGLPVNIVRCSMLLPPCEAHVSAQVNTNDYLTRLLAGVVWTGLRPASLYAGGPSAAKHAHFDGLPVDVAAAGIVALVLHRREPSQLTRVHCVNSHVDDGVSLDTFLDWTANAKGGGYALRIVEPYAVWLSQYSAALDRLPSGVKEKTNASILFQWRQPQTVPDPIQSRIDSRQFNVLLATHTRFPQGVQSLDESYWTHALQQMAAIDILPTPDKESSSSSSSSNVGGSQSSPAPPQEQVSQL